MARLTTLGELTASIAHEINQPLGAMVNSANACVRWLAAQNLERARQSAVRIVADGQRAGEIITRIRALAKNAPPTRTGSTSTTRSGTSSRWRAAKCTATGSWSRRTSPSRCRWCGPTASSYSKSCSISSSTIEAMSGVDDGPRELVVQSDPDAAPGVRVTVRDAGPGLDPQRLDRLFDAFYTTKPHGLGLGLAISRRIVEAHGGRLWATANAPHGAVFQFTVPRERGGRMMTPRP